MNSSCNSATLSSSASSCCTDTLFSPGGPPIDGKSDYDAAAREARQRNRRLFLLLYAPGGPVTANHDRGLFTLRPVRERLAKLVCCRLEVSANDPLARRFGFSGEALMLVLDNAGNQLARLEGAVDRLRFRTYVTEP